ncbi:hypothetical protein M0802_001355 [Mischocyttarus mexicanus]|nr:hypothetical protein M0802_001355 [Mischocyttarus mexicanus]
MGRKIPGKKHRGIKDPEKQHARRLAELATKINAPPKNVQEQAIPRSLENIIRLKEAVKSGRISTVKKSRKKKEKWIDMRGCQETHAFINETAFEKKFNVLVNRNTETGKIEGLSKPPKDELDELEKLRANHKNIKKKKKVKEGEGDTNLTKSQKRRQKLQVKKEKKKEDLVDNFQIFQDEIQFGETVHAPPVLNTKPRKAMMGDTVKPGKRNLLLNSLFAKNDSSNNNSTKSITIDRSGKRKNLPVSERRQLEKEQSSVIAAYRQFKSKRSTDT